MKYLMIFSTIYLILATMSPVMGYYVLRLDYKNMSNRLFMMISICLMFWALGFSVFIVAPDEASAVFWNRVSAVGYELIYSLLLHFTLFLTDHQKILSKKWFYLLMYLPAAVCLYAFAISPDITQAVYQLKNISRGWTRTTSSTVFDTIFQIYYIAVVITSLFLLVFWKLKNRKTEIKKQADFLILSFLVAFGLGTLTDIVNGSYFYIPIPPMAPVFFLIPLSTIYYCINKYHFLKPKKVNKMELILNDERRIIVFRITSYGMILAGVAVYVMRHFWWRVDSTASTIISSAILIAFGVILKYVQKKQKNFDYLELILIIISMTLTPILMINMIRFDGGCLWMLQIMFIMCSLVFNSGGMLVASSLSALLGQIYLAGIKPWQSVIVNHRTYASHEVILIFIIVTAYCIHRIYVGRLSENAAQTRTQMLISDIASGFSLTGKDNMAQPIQSLLTRLLDYFMAETVLIHATESQFAELIGFWKYSTEDSAISPDRKLLIMERWTAYLKENINGSDTLPYEYRNSADRLEKLKFIPWLFIPIFEKEKPVAFLYIETSRTGTMWTQNQLVSLTIISRIVSDTLEKQNSEMRIRFMAYYDNLTKLPNRQLFYDRAHQAIRLARRNNKVVGIIFLDLDFFKSINDTMGHDGGDLLIQTIAQKLTHVLRKSDTVARFGGDEFLIMLNSIDNIEDISKAADKILDIFHEPIILKGQEIFITASAGISVFPADGKDTESLIKNADIAMYTAKEKGKNQYAFCSTNMKETVKYRMNLSNNLYRALDNNELQVYYQPQIDLQTEKIMGFEALLRWFHPDYGMILPMEFIPLAEQTGLINSIGNWVLDTACAQTVAWNNMGFHDLRIAVNLSVVQLRNPNLVTQVDSILKKTGIDPGQVELEITESVMAREPDYIIRILNDLKKLGVSISIDDFGTEYSSLNRLKMLPVDKLKMDIQFVQGIDKSPKDKAISLVIINLAKNLDLKLVAEGVENNTQLDFLKNRMCDEVQGFYYYKPMPSSEIEKILRNRS